MDISCCTEFERNDPYFFDVMCQVKYEGWGAYVYISIHDFQDYFDTHCDKKGLSFSEFERMYDKSINDVAEEIVIANGYKDKTIDKVFEELPDIREALPFTRELFTDLVIRDPHIMYLDQNSLDEYTARVKKPSDELIKELNTDIEKYNVGLDAFDIDMDNHIKVKLFDPFITYFKWKIKKC